MISIKNPADELASQQALIKAINCGKLSKLMVEHGFVPMEHMMSMDSYFNCKGSLNRDRDYYGDYSNFRNAYVTGNSCYTICDDIGSSALSSNSLDIYGNHTGDYVNPKNGVFAHLNVSLADTFLDKNIVHFSISGKKSNKQTKELHTAVGGIRRVSYIANRDIKKFAQIYYSSIEGVYEETLATIRSNYSDAKNYLSEMGFSMAKTSKPREIDFRVKMSSYEPSIFVRMKDGIPSIGKIFVEDANVDYGINKFVRPPKHIVLHVFFENEEVLTEINGIFNPAIECLSKLNFLIDIRRSELLFGLLKDGKISDDRQM